MCKTELWAVGANDGKRMYMYIGVSMGGDVYVKISELGEGFLARLSYECSLKMKACFLVIER